MFISTSTLITLASVSPVALGAVFKRQADPQAALVLDPGVIMKNLAQDGQSGPDVTAGQVRSLTSENNFINFCLTQKVPLTNGLQEKGGSCNQTPMGRIAGIDRMPSCKFTSPENGGNDVKSFSKFTIAMAIRNLQTGNFVNPATNYYAAPAQTNDQGIIIGHSHVTIEVLPDLKTKAALDPNVFAFFKGLNAVANQDGVLSADVEKGLPVGDYRLCSINSAANHQPVLVAVAQHGSLDDCIYFTITPSFTSALGDIEAPSVRLSGIKFKVDGLATEFTSPPEAIAASCDIQRNQCADKANAVGGAGGVTVAACDDQKAACLKQPGGVAADVAAAGNAAGANLNKFDGALGAPPVAINGLNGQFATDGINLPTLASAVERACDAQRNRCADNGNATGFTNGVTIEACDAQSKACKAQPV